MVFLLRCLLWVLPMISPGPWSSLAAPYPEASFSDVMELEVVTSSSGTAVHEAPSSSEVLLRVSFADGQAHGDFSLFDCAAVSEDGSHQVKLTDFTGCPAMKSPMGCMVEENDLLVSPAFKLSSLADQGVVNITCSWETCSTPHHPKCTNRCDFFTRLANAGRRHRRQSRDEHARSGARHSVTTTIRVLPSHVRHDHGGAPPAVISHHGHHGMRSGMRQPSRTPAPNVFQHQQAAMTATYPSPLMYLNPIVCSLFLLILSVFLGFYVSFVRSLSRSVQHIKTEIDRQRSRDKFLVPEYHE